MKTVLRTVNHRVKKEEEDPRKRDIVRFAVRVPAEVMDNWFGRWDCVEMKKEMG